MQIIFDFLQVWCRAEDEGVVVAGSGENPNEMIKMLFFTFLNCLMCKVEQIIFHWFRELFLSMQY